MAVNSVNNSSNLLRFSGMATGLDTEGIIKQLMDAERIPLNRLMQQKTMLEWKRDNYREVTSVLQDFKNQFFDVLNSSSYMLSPSNFKMFNVESTNSNIATAVAGSSAVAATHTIKGTQLADVSRVSSGAGVSGPLQGGGAAATDFSGGNNKINVTLDGVTKTITLSARDYGDVNTLINDGTDGLQKLVNDAFGNGRIIVTADAFDVLNFSAANSKVTLNDAASNSALSNLGFSNGSSNRINLNDTLLNLQNKFAVPLTFNGGNVDFTINGQAFSISQDTKLSDMMNQINNSSAGVEIKYSEATDKFTMVSKQKGSGNNIVITSGVSNFFAGASGINAGSYAGKDAQFELDGVAMTRSDNTFTVDGVSYTLKDESGTSATLTVGQNIDGSFEKIKNFVSKYNELITKINGELSEKSNRSYQPLTAEQKKEMSEDDIKAWESKAKSGLLKSDSILGKIAVDLRRATYDTISGLSESLEQIGIKHSTEYKDNGLLIIDEAKLKDALRTKPDTVQNLFTKSSTTYPAYDPDRTAADRKIRYNEQGIAFRFFDVIQDAVRTTRNSKGEKGLLVEKAGLVGDLSEFKNFMENEIDEKNKYIDKLNAKLWTKENRYYRTFTALEKAVSQMNSQSSWLSQQMGQ